MTTEASTPDSNCTLALPAHASLLLAAAQFAAKDEAENVLNAVCLRKSKDGETLNICATNGRVLFRATVSDGDWTMEQQELLLPAEALRKTCAKAWTALVRNDVIELLDCKGAVLQLRPMPPIPGISGHTFPRFEMLIPDSFTNTPKAPVGFCGSYLTLIGKAAAALSPTGVVKMETNDPHSPVVFSLQCSSGTVQLLVMPMKLKF
jgi:hypothetical protein